MTWLFLAGRGAGKTRAGAEWVRGIVKQGIGRLALIAPTAADARDVMIEGESGILATAWQGDRDHKGNALGLPIYQPSVRRVTWGNGAQASIFSAEEPDRLRGPQHEAIWADELAAWVDPQETWDMAMFGLRIGDNPQAMVTTTPRPLPIIRNFIADSKGDHPTVVVTRAATYENRANLAKTFISTIIGKYEGTRKGRQELQAEVLDDIPGALWTRAMLDKARKDAQGRVITVPPRMTRVVVAIDPSGASGAEDDTADAIGIVAAGKGIDGLGYVLADRTCVLSPDGWGRRAVETYDEFKGDRIVAERNFGGAMVEHVIRTVDKRIPYKDVTASRGKSVRAEPVAALYEQGKVKHVSPMPDLEDEMCAFTSTGYMGDGSPNRSDALVWALTELFFGTPAYGMMKAV